jgi:hypothetical protein
MRKMITTFVATAMLATVPLAISTQQASATHQFGHAVAGGIIGGIIGGAIVNSTRPRQPDVVYVQPQPRTIYVQPQPVYQGFSQNHYNWCYNKYRSYDAGSNTFQPYSGPRQPCYSPY